jgi:myo-inositol-1(or 4)-monophosphatase
MHNHENLRPFFNHLADVAGEAILPLFRSPLLVDNKKTDAFDPVTAADKAAERAMRAAILSVHPDHGILGEEYGDEGLDRDDVWVLDPIDGTRSFIAGVPLWGTLIGLRHKGKAVMGMMAQPFIGERFFGDGRSANYTGPGGARELRTRPCKRLADATLFTTTPSLFTVEERPVYDAIEAAVRMPRYGTDCYGYCMLAAGSVDLVIETGLKPYDVMALIPIIEGAGGVITTWDGGNPAEAGRIVAAGDPALHAIVLDRLNG